MSVENWINRSTVVKKNNAVDHIKSNFHRVSVLRLKDHASKGVLKFDAEQASCSTDIGKHQTTLSENVKTMLATHKTELIKKFQLAHFTVTNNYSFNTYEKTAKFEKEVHDVKLGNGFLTNVSGKEIVMYLSKAELLAEITEPLNNKTCLYYSLLTDGSSSAKTMDEKELVLIKTCLNGSPKITVLALEEPESGDADGLKKALDHAYGKGNFSFERKHREVGLCTDGTSTNKKVHRME